MDRAKMQRTIRSLIERCNDLEQRSREDRDRIQKLEADAAATKAVLLEGLEGAAVRAAEVAADAVESAADDPEFDLPE